VERDLAVAGSLVREHPKLRQVLLHPTFPVARKLDLAGRVMKVCAPVKELLSTLIELRALRIIGRVARAYRSIRAAKASEAAVAVFSAVRLSAAECGQIRDALEHCLGKPVKLVVKTDRNLLGGVLVKAGERIIDGTIKGAFDRLEREILSSSSQFAGSRSARRKGRR
jgi:ATP synthase F1 delta subunit